MKQKLLQVRLEKELLDELKTLSKSNSISMSGQVRMLIKKALKDA